MLTDNAKESFDESKEQEVLFRNKKSSLREGIDNFDFKPDTKVLVFAREVSDRGISLGTEVTFFTSTEKEPLRTSFYVPNEHGLVLDLFFTIDYSTNSGYPDEPYSNEYSTAAVKELSINLRKLLNKCPLTALNTDTLNTIDKNTNLARFIEDHCISEYRLKKLTVSEEIKSIFGCEEGLVISETTPTNLVHTVYADLREW